MQQIIAIAAGGALGALMRFWVSSAVYAWLGRGFPWGTLSVNLLGSYVIGFSYILFIERLAESPTWRAAIVVGFLGAFTTFSTFSLETWTAIEEGQLAKAAANVVTSVLLCLFATWLGIVTARQL